MIEINLLPEELRKRDRFKIPLPDLPVSKMLVYAIGAFFLLQVLGSVFTFYLKGRLAGLQHEIHALTTQNKDVTLRKNEVMVMNARLKEVASLTSRKFFWTHLLNASSDSITKGVWLTNFSLVEAQESEVPAGGAEGKNPARAVIKKNYYLRLEGSVVGQGQETAYIGKFIKELKENARLNELFGDVKLSNIDQKKIRDVDVYDFVLMCKFREGRF